MKRLSILAAGLLVGAAAFQFSSVASGQSDGWVTLVDGSKMGDWTEVGKANWAMKDGALVADKLRRQGTVLSRQQEILQGFPDQGRVLGRRRRQQRHLHPLRRQRQDRCQDLLRGEHLRQAAGSDLRHRRDRRCRPRSIRCRRRAANGIPSRSRRKGSHLVVVLNGQKTVDAQDINTRQRTVGASIRLRRDQVPQGPDQAAVAAGARSLARTGSPVFRRVGFLCHAQAVRMMVARSEWMGRNFKVLRAAEASATR